MARTYEFVLRGRVARDVVPALSGFSRSERDGCVVLEGSLEPGVVIGDVLAQFAALGLGLHAVRELYDDPADPERAEPEAGGSSWPGEGPGDQPA